MGLPTAEHVRILRETKARRNAAARERRRKDEPRQVALSLRLPGVLSWARPREQPIRGGGHRTAYPAEYVSGRDTWRFFVGAAVRETGWTAPPVSAALSVEADVVAGGKLDLDRVTTAILDALQAGGALVDDCRVYRLVVRRSRPGKGPDGSAEAPHVDLVLAVLEG